MQRLPFLLTRKWEIDRNTFPQGFVWANFFEVQVRGKRTREHHTGRISAALAGGDPHRANIGEDLS
jgi:hypothetical protein